MDAGYFGLLDAHSASWALAPWQWELECLPPRHGVSVPLHSTFGGELEVPPPESSVVPRALHLHLSHYLVDTFVYVRQRRIAQHGEGDMLYWFHLKPC